MLTTQEIPDILRSKLLLIEKYFADVSHPCIDAVHRLLLTSDYAFRHRALLQELLAEDNLQHALGRSAYQSMLSHISFDTPQPQYAKVLRLFRHKHLLRVYLRELAGIAVTEETLLSWSDCADALILHCLDYCQHQLKTRFGTPRDSQGKTSHLLTLAMGKLGGRELNFSSDIDLIFAFSANGETDGKEQISNQQFYSRVIQLFVQCMQNISPEGFIFRVDLRLRPNGESGPLVSSLAAMETYYQEQGRDWERYAMVKARVIQQVDENACKTLYQIINPFVYRRYVDFSVIESLRSMKAMIEREVKLDPRLDDIKRGQGGIREVEFIIQSVQLIRGGRMPQLRQQNAMNALSILRKERLLDRAEALKQAYLFLRRLENVLQILNDQQIHCLPEEPIKKIQVAYAMHYTNWEDFFQRLQQYQRIISHSFQSVLKKMDVYEDEKRLLTKQLANIWHGHIEQNMAVNWLASIGFKEPERCYQMIHAFRHSPRCRRLTQTARIRLDRFMTLLLTELSVYEETDKILLQVIQLLENIVTRSAYLALLTENPSVLKELLFWFAHSPFISSLLVSQPFLLEILLDQDKNWKPLSKKRLADLLKAQLAHSNEPELKEEILRQFKLTHWLLAARAEVYHREDAVRIGRFLSDVAEIIVGELFILACEQLSEKYPDISHIQSNFAIIAYGKSGSREMNYASDLDLVFLHTAKSSEESLVTRLTQKILHMLMTRSQAGILYSVDTRLRPSGSAGLLVSHLDTFIDYQKTHAWTWEHQALVKARVLLGSSHFRRSFNHLKKYVLSLPRDEKQLKKDILDMRAKINHFQRGDEVKYAPGGLFDLEFLLQFLILRAAQPIFSRLTHPLSQMEKLYRLGILPEEQFKILNKAYRSYHAALHQSVIQEGKFELKQMRLDVLGLMKEIYS
ncbi:bifunctional [glutamate--ammonia ligase]-adenylyl-L-tyrosine phosphorylase/[glutamate--ammonia-ligase] adenylyltransferase [Legionella israelensis]|uniref:bifunctional [glutamate--ammonia ligase]-adenylyl-L-tyrosine phosphorylase/[glutamate--ammonia-ligase] adenylyltransferase n=1 Tax=Legionella israelensis TaxID=454 RepID=UPI00117EE57C|nr:bifunctional [glutamate--ammonia ligase]-adenylyl-L-tyrosine phosphorylase/[glutamate--ammonia-ligase] adenylyltransferase [Legionella israelensis]QDP72255.1 bifunctional [glutamate--ammonia ligase]-adenylyl-L-tyrosine phosphorylase/[glutamate--ammonia-ligase] adenylyltransferase [Legionella israelensis]